MSSSKTRSVVIKAKKVNPSPPFPLYDRIVQQVATKGLKEVDKKIWPQISKLESKNATIVYLIILNYARLHGNVEEVPYSKKIYEGGKGVIYDVDSIPLELQLILSECLNEITSP